MTVRQTSDPTVDGRLQNCLEEALEVSGLRPISSAFVLDLETSAGAQWRSGENIYPASVIKVPIMVEAFHQFEQGDLRPAQRFEISESNQTPTAEETPFIPGYKASVQEMIELMIARSDNIATNQLMDVLRRERVTAYMHELGLATFMLGRKLSGSEPLIADPEIAGRNRLPACEIGSLLQLIANDDVPGAARQREILSRCVHNDKLVPGLQAGDLFLHKTGETSDTSHDAGILYTGQRTRRVIVLYTTPAPSPSGADAVHANPQMASFMRALRPCL